MSGMLVMTACGMIGLVVVGMVILRMRIHVFHSFSYQWCVCVLSCP